MQVYDISTVLRLINGVGEGSGWKWATSLKNRSASDVSDSNPSQDID